jgi:hypothetical protein
VVFFASIFGFFFGYKAAIFIKNKDIIELIEDNSKRKQEMISEFNLKMLYY